MGQYYRAVNVDKQEFISPHAYACGAKLTAFSYIDKWRYELNSFLGALVKLLKEDWKGDRVYLVGDYADKEWLNEMQREGEERFEPVRGLYDELEWLGKPNPDNCGYPYTLYACDKFFTERKGVDPEFCAAAYLCNSLTREYIDIASTPPEDDAGAIYPLPLLIAVGNGQGGGDYCPGNGSESGVGYWIPYVQGIFFSDTVPEGYEEYRPDFEECELLGYK